jgi:hypothetical protein
MRIILGITLVLSALEGYGLANQGASQKADKTVEIIGKGLKPKFVERGKEKAEIVTLVVGQTVRWENKDTKDHRLVSDLKIDEKSLFDTGVIKPGAHKDLVINFDMYKSAGGKPANVIKLKYHSVDQESLTGELQVLSAARRSIGRR